MLKPRRAASTIAYSIPPYATSTTTLPSPATSTGRWRCKTNDGTLRKRTRTHRPPRHSAVTRTNPPGVSSVSTVSGSRIGSMPVSSSAVTVPIVLEPDIGT
jgi:hypothetical protein